MASKETLYFIKEHLDDNIRQLALKAYGKENIDLPYALDQIAGFQTARRKLPSWAKVEGIVFPQHISMEQCSSEVTALYKSSLLDTDSRSMTKEKQLIDLTGGFGVDFSFLAKSFSKATYVERHSHLCDIARENFARLGLGNTEVVCADSVAFLNTVSHVSLIYLDPARRDNQGARTFAIADCTPDVVSLRDKLLAKADKVMIKLSPMLDWRKAVADLGTANVSQVHIVSVDNECKELLVIMSGRQTDEVEVCCANIITTSHPHSALPSEATPRQHYLYEPNASIMKAGCYTLVEERYGIAQIAPNSHLFVADALVDDFPGRTFAVERVATMNKRELRSALKGISSANIAVRNFPMTAVELGKRLKLKEGGEWYLFATTDQEGKHILYFCRKVVQKAEKSCKNRQIFLFSQQL